MIRVVIEDEEIAAIRRNIKSFNMKRLALLEEVVRREKDNRQRQVFNEWLKTLNEYINKSDDSQ